MERLALAALLFIGAFQSYSMNEKNVIESKETSIARRDSDERLIRYHQTCGCGTPRSNQDRYRDIHEYLFRCGIDQKTVHVKLFDGKGNGFFAKTNSLERRFKFDKRWWDPKYIKSVPYVITHEIGHLIDDSTLKIFLAPEGEQLLVAREAELRADNFAIKNLVDWSCFEAILIALTWRLKPALRGKERLEGMHPTYVEEYKNMVGALKELHYDIVCSFSIENSKVYITLLKNGKPIGNQISFKSQPLAALISSIIMMDQQQKQEDKEIYG